MPILESRFKIQIYLILFGIAGNAADLKELNYTYA